MWLRHLEADRLRNLQAVQLDLSAGLTVVTGRNGQGKTALLEAIYLLGTGRSFRSRRLDELIAWTGGPLRVAGEVESALGPVSLAVLVEQGSRRLLADSVETDLERFIGRLDVIDMSAPRMNVLKGPPDERRRFLDRGIVAQRPSYLRSLGAYRRTLQQRNALLRGAGGRVDDRQLSAWDDRLTDAANELHHQRREYAVLLSGKLGEASGILFPDGNELTLHYRPSPAEANKVESSESKRVFRDKLDRGRERDRTLGYTGQGPHRDETSVEIDGVDLRRFGSSGQVRAAMIALKLGKLALLRDTRGEAPLFLMDDFDTDIDEARASALAGYLDATGFQAVVATSKEAMADRFGISVKKVRMSDGVLRTS